MLHPVYLNMIRRAQLCIDVGGNHFHHLLWWYILSAFGYRINFCIYAILWARATFSLPILYIRITEYFHKKLHGCRRMSYKWYEKWLTQVRWNILAMNVVSKSSTLRNKWNYVPVNDKGDVVHMVPNRVPHDRVWHKASVKKKDQHRIWNIGRPMVKQCWALWSTSFNFL